MRAACVAFKLEEQANDKSTFDRSVCLACRTIGSDARLGGIRSVALARRAAVGSECGLESVSTICREIPCRRVRGHRQWRQRERQRYAAPKTGGEEEAQEASRCASQQSILKRGTGGNCVLLRNSPMLDRGCALQPCGVRIDIFPDGVIGTARLSHRVA